MQTDRLSQGPVDGRASTKPPRLHLAYLDGIRGIAALYVVLQHIYIALTFLAPNVKLVPAVSDALASLHVNPRLIALGGAFLSHCFFFPVVQVFIVLSGYCLMLPAVPAGGQLRGGFPSFIARRATRILPPYFVMIVISLAIAAVVDRAALVSPPLHELEWGKILSHVLLIHNWNPAWIHAVDPPMWSIAVEWQIYFLFPLLLLPVWRRAGTSATLLVAFLVGVAPHFLLGGFLDWSYPWFLGLFALGMLAAELSLSERPRLRALQERVPWGYVALGLMAVVIGLGVLKNGWGSHHAYFADALAGLATMALLVSCTRASRPGAGPHLGLRVLTARPATALGAFSYSLYLTHYPPMKLFFLASLLLPMSVLARAGLMYGVFLPLAIASAYGFYVLFERPFIRHAPSQAQAEPEPAPSEALSV